MNNAQRLHQQQYIGKLSKPRSVFAPGHRIRMNIVPLFINLCVPWAIFVFCAGTNAFWIRWAHPGCAAACLGLVGLLVAISLLVAFWARRRDPDPTWFSYLALISACMAVAGAVAGNGIYTSYSRKYYEIMDLKIAKGIDASVTQGTSVIDAGIFEFLPGNHFKTDFSWHFIRGTVYCVAPIISNTSDVPLHQTYDFWAVGKDCCSTSASDFRCGSWGSAKAKSGIRVMDPGDTAFYRLAVQQTTSLYDILAPNPIFLTWAASPELEVTSWTQQAFKDYLVNVAVAGLACLFFMAMAVVKFAWIGRSESVYSEVHLNDPGWAEGGNAKPLDYGAHRYT